MKLTLALLALYPLLSFADPVPAILDTDWDLRMTARGQLSSGEKFESIGTATFAGLDSSLSQRGGFDAAYRDFKAQNNITYGVWQESEAFRDYLRECNIDVPTDQLAMRIGLKKIFASASDAEVTQVFEELSPKLTFEQKIELGSRLGGLLLENYDYSRASGGPNSKGIVTFRDMINGRRNGKPSGVCRDMSQAIAVSLKAMGVDQVYVVAYQTIGAGHATVLVQDPNNPMKTYNINYNYQTSTEAGNSLSHLQQDSTIPSVGTDMRIFTAEGKQLQNLPTNLGLALNEIAGREAKDMDPMLRSENQIGVARYNVGHGISVGAGVAATADGDKIIATTARLHSGTEVFPMEVSVVLYHNERDTNLRGDLKSNGMYIEGEQRIISSPLKVRTRQGEVQMNVEGRINFNVNSSFSKLSGSTQGTKFSESRDATASAAIAGSFRSNNGSTNVNSRLEATGGLSTPDVRDGYAMSFDLRNVTGSVEVSQKIAQNLEGFAGASATARPAFGAQSRQETGLLKRNSDGSITSILLGHEGQIAGEAPVFIPGSRERLTVDARFEKQGYAVSGGVFCRQNVDGMRDCGARTSATISLGGKKKN